jgi:hypothetical protein
MFDLNVILDRLLASDERLQAKATLLAVEYSPRPVMTADNVRFEVLTAVSINIMILRNVNVFL